jgi:hypothetical protein
MASRKTVLCLALLLLAPGFGNASAARQKYAPVVGRWRIEMNIEGVSRTLEFQTDGHGSGGLGTGYFVLAPSSPDSVPYPAAWSNYEVQEIRITGEVIFSSDSRPQYFTLILRTTLKPGEPIKGDAVLIDTAFRSHRGQFSMTRISNSF